MKKVDTLKNEFVHRTYDFDLPRFYNKPIPKLNN